MCTAIRPEISRKNKYWISKHRYHELRHFCRQYPEWKKSKSKADIEKIRLLESTANEADQSLGMFLLKGITEGMSYESLNARYSIPCCRHTYYDLYRRFFWLLSRRRN